jgi:hypothetical protein
VDPMNQGQQPATATPWRLAIDVGTSNTAAAVQIGTGPPRPVRLSDQADQMPSGVLAGPAGLVVGVEALRSARLDPGAFEACPKRRVGEGTMLLGTHDVPVSAAIAAILRHVFVRAARVGGGGPPAEVILTYPEHWQAGRRQVLLDAARAAGLVTVPRLVSEPIAAAAHYATKAVVPPGSVVAVFDFGGGTCDVAVLRAGPADGPGPAVPFTVLATEGVDPLGGEDLDDLLEQWTHRQLQASGRHTLLAALDDPGALAQRLTFREQVRAAKQALTDYESTQIPVAAGGEEAVVTITAEEFDRLIESRIAAAVDLTGRTLHRAGVLGPALHTLYLTGGSSHLRLVQRRLTGLIQRPPATLEDPKLVVALGALALPVPAGPPPPQLPPPPPQLPPVPPLQPSPPVAWWRRPVTIAGVAALVMLLAVTSAFALDTGDDEKPDAGSSQQAPGSGTSTSPPVPPTTDPPTTAPTVPPTSGPSAAACALPADECLLISRLPTDYVDPATCQRQDPPGPDQVALVRCGLPATASFGTNPGVEIFATKFASQRAMDAAIDGISSDYKLTFTAQGCFDLNPAGGRSTWRRRDRVDPLGQVLCYATDRSARIFWSYDGEAILMAAVAKGPDVPAIVRWWTSDTLSAALR